MPERHVHIADAFEVVADAVPDRVALITNDAQRTYRELDERATRLANHLADRGIVAGDHVAIHAMNCVEWVEAFYACFKMRAVPINVNYRYVEKELRYLYDNSDTVAAIVAPEFTGDLERATEGLAPLRYTLVLGEPYEKALAEASPERTFGERSEDDLYIVYTGGTTGMPKGVMWRHGDLVPAALNSYRYGAPVEPVERFGEEAAANETPMRLQMMGPLMHGGTQWAVSSTHLAGGIAILYSLPRFDPHEVLQMVGRHRVMSLNVMGDAMARPIADLLARPDAPAYDLSSLMAIANAAAPISTALRAEITRAIPHAMLVDSYGSSETGATGIEPGADKHAHPTFHVGPETTVLGKDGRPCAEGEQGMLARSGHIPLGYYGDPKKTEESFCTVDGKRWALSGDNAVVGPGGAITILGRGSVCINTGGEKVFPEEVESALMEHPDVLDAAVVGTPSDIWGEQVTALVRLRPGHEATADGLKRHCREHVAGYKVPKEVLFVDEVPRTPVGKVDYRATKSRVQELLGAGVAR